MVDNYPWNKGLKGVIKLSDETKIKISRSLTGRLHTNAHNLKVSMALKGKSKSDQHIKNLTGKKRSEESKKRMSISQKNNLNNLYVNGEATKRFIKNNTGKKYSIERCKKISIGRKEMLKNNILLRKKIAMSDTKPELIMKAILSKLNIEYEHPYFIKNIKHFYLADFFIPKLNLIIEVDGKYWHNYPFGKEIDNIRTNEIKEVGYNILRFWENQIDLNGVKTELEAITGE